MSSLHEFASSFGVYELIARKKAISALILS